MKSERDYYQILHVHPEAPREIIKSSYRTLMQRMRMHPDLGGDNESAAIINEAYAVLMEPSQREAYDKSRMAGAANDSFSAQDASRQSSQAGNNGGAFDIDAACRFCRAPFTQRGMNSAAEFCGECGSPRFMAEQAQDDSADRRSILRVPKNCSVTFCTHWPQPQSYAGLSEDISLTGMRFRSAIGLQTGQVIKVDAPVLRAVAQVTRLVQRSTHWEVGVAFLSLHFERARGSFVADCV